MNFGNLVNLMKPYFARYAKEKPRKCRISAGRLSCLETKCLSRSALFPSGGGRRACYYGPCPHSWRADTLLHESGRQPVNPASAAHSTGKKRLPMPGAVHACPGLLRGEGIAILQQLDRDIVGRAHEGHPSVARGAIDCNARRLQFGAFCIDIFD